MLKLMNKDSRIKNEWLEELHDKEQKVRKIRVGLNQRKTKLNNLKQKRTDMEIIQNGGFIPGSSRMHRRTNLSKFISK